MLYYSGFTRRLGDVDEGSTVTDFLPAERARGITIQSAAITFQWPPGPGPPSPDTPALPRSFVPHNINLIDTPGHADFTFEVLRSLRVLDGAVCILDGVAGVEAQTEKVWTQASLYQIPTIVFVNKLDRDGAAFGRTFKQIGERLGSWPAVCVIPWWTPKGGLKGVCDVVGLRALRYPEGSDGKTVNVFSLAELEIEDPRLASELKKARTALVELLSEHDDMMVELFLEHEEDHLAISAIDTTESLRRCVLQSPQAVVPVFAGASFRNIGVQPLLDAVVDLLPSPEERPDSEMSLGATKGGLADFLAGKLTFAGQQQKKNIGKAVSTAKATYGLQNLEACALAFKVVTDPRRGVLVYVRVYSGSINRNASLFNTNLQLTERAPRLFRMLGNDVVEIDAISAGQIGVIPGLKFARTGDTLISYIGANPKIGPPAPINQLQLRPIDVPPPVFFTSVEPNNLAEDKHVRECLDLLLREDPSLHVSIDEESGQTHLAGMGELHLEIARDRLINDFKAKARIGSIEIGYREALTAESDVCHETYDREVSGKASNARCSASVAPRREGDETGAGDKQHVFELQDENVLVVRTPTLDLDGSPIGPEIPALPATLPSPVALSALQTGTSAALARGPTNSYPLHSTWVHVTFNPAEHVFPNTTPAALSSAARLAVQRALRESAKAGETVLMEPVMLATISIDEASLGSVVHDLSSARGGQVISLGSDSSDSSQQYAIDVNRIYAPPDPFAGGHSAAQPASTAGSAMRQVVARVPLKEMIGYLKHLRSLTGGRGTFVMSFDRFERMNGQRQKAVLDAMRGAHA